MGKTLILGNESTIRWAEKIANSENLILSKFTVDEKGERDLYNILKDIIPNDATSLVIDVDAITPLERSLSIALCLRLAVVEMKAKALMPILLVTNSDERSLLYDKTTKFTPVLLTKGIAIDTPDNVADAVANMKRLEPEEYFSEFLDYVKIKPKATEGRHSIANQWGADVLRRIVEGGITKNVAPATSPSFYYNYTLLQTLTSKELVEIINGKENKLLVQRQRICARGKKILLIDDEADKGWDTVLKEICINNDRFEKFSQNISDYDGLSEEYRNNIEKDRYDLIFLDLRMNGMDEEDTLDPMKFSGMKILKEIKAINEGTQVIMFTASNKAWNLKALLDAGADGYYIKESPEYRLPIKYSEQNAMNLIYEIEKCIERSYLRNIFRNIDKIKKTFKKARFDKELKHEICNHLDVSFSLLKDAGKKDENMKYAYAYIELEQILEAISKNYIDEKYIDKKEEYKYLIKDSEDDCPDWDIIKGECVESSKHYNDYPLWKRIATIYYKVFAQEDKSFGKKIKDYIEKRNLFIHNDLTKNKKIEDIFEPTGYKKLFATIEELLYIIIAVR